MKKKTFFQIAVIGAALFAASLIGCGNSGSDSNEAAVTASPAALAAQADTILQYDMDDPQQRTQALFIYRQVLALTNPDNPADLPLRARANLGLGLINFYDLFDVLPALFNMLGLNPAALLGGLSLPIRSKGLSDRKSNMSGAPVSSMALCTPVNFGPYLPGLDLIASNMISPAAGYLKQALIDDVNVSMMVEHGKIVITADNPLTPANEELAIDLSGEWDAGDIGAVSGVLEILEAVIKILSAYNGVLQNFINPSFTPDCAPAPGSPEWIALFGPYGVINPDGGFERMTEAGVLLNSALASIGASFAFVAAETDDQSDDLIRYWDVGTDGIGPDDPAYSGPDANGTEGNGVYDPGERWGMSSVGALLDGFIGGLLPVTSGQMSQVLTLPLLAGLLDNMADSVATGAPVDLMQSVLKQILSALLGGGSSVPDKTLYSLGIPALNLGAPFNPPWPTLDVMNPLKDALGNTIVEVEASDTSHDWPAPYVRTDAPNGVVDPAYSFYPDLDESGDPVGVFGGLLLQTVTTPDDFDADGNLIGTVDYPPMMNGPFNATMTLLNMLLGML